MSIASRIRAGREASKSRRPFRAKASSGRNGKPQAEPEAQPQARAFTKPPPKTEEATSEQDTILKLEPPPPPIVKPETENLEIERLRGENDRLRREVQSHQDASDRWECPDGFQIDTDRVEVNIEGTAAQTGARVHHFIARHVASDWASERHIDKATAIRSAWLKYAELERAEAEAQRDELQRRWDQRKKTMESKAKKGADAEE